MDTETKEYFGGRFIDFDLKKLKKLTNCICQHTDLKERNGHTASCNRETRKAEAKKTRQKIIIREIRKQSPKMAKALLEYVAKKKKWIVGKKCAVFPDLPATEPHHMKGKATKELLMDERFWLPVSRPGHTKIELNPAWAKEMGFSKSRLADN